jgi:hypothetical protein
MMSTGFGGLQAALCGQRSYFVVKTDFMGKAKTMGFASKPPLASKVLNVRGFEAEPRLTIKP